MWCANRITSAKRKRGMAAFVFSPGLEMTDVFISIHGLSAVRVIWPQASSSSERVRNPPSFYFVLLCFFFFFLFYDRHSLWAYSWKDETIFLSLAEFQEQPKIEIKKKREKGERERLNVQFLNTQRRRRKKESPNRYLFLFCFRPLSAGMFTQSP